LIPLRRGRGRMFYAGVPLCKEGEELNSPPSSLRCDLLSLFGYNPDFTGYSPPPFGSRLIRFLIPLRRRRGGRGCSTRGGRERYAKRGRSLIPPPMTLVQFYWMKYLIPPAETRPTF